MLFFGYDDHAHFPHTHIGTYLIPVKLLWAVLALGVGVSAASAQLDRQQMQIINDTAQSVCNTVKDAKGQKSELQLQGDVKAQLSGLIGKVVDVGGSGKGSLTRDEFEGLSRDATATALEGDRGCRERVFNKMFDKLSSISSEVTRLKREIELRKQIAELDERIAENRIAEEKLKTEGERRIAEGERRIAEAERRLAETKLKRAKVIDDWVAKVVKTIVADGDDTFAYEMSSKGNIYDLQGYLLACQKVECRHRTQAQRDLAPLYQESCVRERRIELDELCIELSALLGLGK